jgi:hypothetical protein
LIFEVPAIHAQFKKVIAGITVSVFKTVMKLLSMGCFNNVGAKAEVVTQGEQGIFMDPSFILSIKVGKDSSVLSQ